MKYRNLLMLAGTLLCAATVCAHEYYAKSFTVIHPWAEATGEGVRNAPVYVKFDQVTAGDKLLSAHTPHAEKVELRTATDLLSTEPIVIIDGTTLELTPGTAHLTMVNLKEPLQWGRSYPMTLVFEQSGPIGVMVSIGAH